VGVHRSWEAGLRVTSTDCFMQQESNVYGDLGMEAKRRIQQRLVEFVKRRAPVAGKRTETVNNKCPINTSDPCWTE